MRLRGRWPWFASAALLAAGACSVDGDYDFGGEAGASAAAPSNGGSVASNPGGNDGRSGGSAGSALVGVSCNDSPCKNGGTCHQGTTGVACGCPSGFSGPTCEDGGSGGRSSATGGRASASSGGVAAGVGSGGTATSSGGLQGTGGFDHPCFPNPCLNNGYCMLEGDDYRCDCNGYQGRLCEDDLDECAETPGPCAAGETCRNYPGSFGCPCLAGFTGADCDLPILEWFTLPEGWRACIPTDVSEDGDVVVGYCTVTPSGKRAFRWTHDEGISSLGNLGTESSAEAVSSDGRVVVGTYLDSADGRHMFRWTSATGMLGETGLESETGSEAYDVNADGAVVVGVSYPRSAFRWTQGERSNLGTINSSGARGVSDDGGVVVGEDDYRAFRWTAAAGLEPLPQPPQGGDTAAHAISPDGRIIAGYGAAGGLIWTGNSVQVIPQFDRQINAVSNTGIVVTGSVVWDGLQMRTAEDALQDAGVVLDQHVTAISGITGDGRHWVGYGAGGGFIARVMSGG